MQTNLFDAIALQEPRPYAAGELLYRQDTANPYVYVIRRGFVDLVATNPIDGLERSVSWRGPGHLVGHASVVLAAPAPVTARTATPCLLHRIPAPAFLAALRPDRAPILWHLVRVRSQQLLDLTQTMALFASAHAQQRLEYVLWRLATLQRGAALASGRDLRLTEYSPTNRELAGYIGVNPTYVPELFAALERAGVARRHRGAVVVSDVARLFRPSVATRPGAAVPWSALLDLGVPRRFDAGYSLFQQGDPAEDVYLVESGFVDLSAASDDTPASDERPLWWASARALLGDTALLLGQRERVTATTRTRSLLHRLTARSFLAALDSDRDPVLHGLLLLLCEEVQTATLDAVAVRRPLREALAHVLGRLVEQHGGWQTRTEVQLTDYSPNNAALAGYVGTEERYLSHLLHRLKGEQTAWRGAHRVLTVRQTLPACAPREAGLDQACAS